MLSGVSFADPALFDTGGQGSYRSVMADFSGDGKLDVAVQNGGDVSILLGDGQGQFTIPLKYPTGGSGPNSLLVLDVDRDNHPDLVVGDVNDMLSVLMNDGQGGFGAPTTYPSGGYDTTCLAAADLNGDGFSDIVVTHAGWSNPNVAVLFSDGYGGFGTPATYPIPGGIVGGVVIGDFNSDHWPDLLVITDMADGTARLLLNSGDGTFTAAGAFADGGWRSCLAAVGDLNGDDYEDVAIGNLNSGNVGVLLGDGQGGFQPVTTYATGGNWAAIPALADLNGDGNADLVINNQFSNTLAVLVGNGQGGFASPIVFATGGSQPGNPSVGDLNGDGRPDIVAVNSPNSQVAVFLNTTVVQELPSPVVTAATDVVDSWDGLTSLREAISYANTETGDDTITFDPGLAGQTITLVHGELALTDITGKTTIVGLGADQLTIDGNRLSRVFNVASGVTAEISGLTVTKGSAADAGGIYSFGSLTIDNCAITDNYAASSGGGIFQQGGSLTVSRTSVVGNTSGHAAGVLAYGVPSVTIIDSHFENNTAGVDGGGLYFYASTGTVSDCSFVGNKTISSWSLGGGGGIKNDDHAHMTIVRCEFSGNSAAYGGVIHNMHDSKVKISQSTFRQNHAGVSGGAIRNIWGSTVELSDVTIADNDAGVQGGGIYNEVSLLLTNVTIAGNEVGSGGTGGGLRLAGGATLLRNVLVAENWKGSGAGATEDDVSGAVDLQSSYNLIGDGAGTNLTNGVQGNQIGNASNPINPLLSALRNYGGPTQTMALLPGSPAIDAGDNSGAPATDQRGLPRITDGDGDGTALVDIGAFETPTANHPLFWDPLTSESGIGNALFIEVIDFNGDRIDFNGDGWTDVALMSAPGTLLGIRMGNGDGSFGPVTTYSTGGTDTGAFPLYGLVVGDFNRDNKPDVAVAADSGHISVLLNQGDGTFHSAVTYSSGGTRAVGLAAGYLNDDEFVDIVVANNLSTIGVLLGNGDGSFGGTLSYSSGGNNPENKLALADFDSDGHLDVVVGNGWSDTLAVLAGNGDGTLRSAVTYRTSPPVNARPGGLAVADFNLDGRPDAVAALVFDGSVNVFLAKPDGTLDAAQRIPSFGNWSANVTTADVDSDGKPDIVVSNQYSNTITLLMGNGDGTFALGATLASGGSQPCGVTVGDVNNDGRPDLVTVNYGSGTLAVLLGSGPIADAGGPYELMEGGSAVLDGSASFDPDSPGSTLIYEWDFDNNGEFGENDTVYGNETGPQPTFFAAGLDGGVDRSVPVSLRVTDDRELSHTVLTTISVMNVAPTASVSGPTEVFRDVAETFTFSASDPSPVDQAAGFTYQIDWDGDGTVDQTESGGATLQVSHVFTQTGTSVVTVTASDKDDGMSGPTALSVVVNAIAPTDLASVIASLSTTSTTEVILNDISLANISAFVEQIANLPPRDTDLPDLTITFNLAKGNYGVGHELDVPEGYVVVLSGKNHTVTIVGSSPALIVHSGKVRVEDGVTFSNGTDAPTILVEGGQLTIRDCTIEETDGGDRAAIEISGGTVDLGTTETAGGNTINIRGPGDSVRNLGSNPVSAVGNAYQLNGVAIASSYRIEDEIFHALDAGGAGLVTYVAGNVYVTANSGSIQRGVDAVLATGIVNVEGVDEELELTFVVTGSDLTLSAADLPEGASFDPVTGLFNWTPNESQQGAYTVTFTATDNGTPPNLSNYKTVAITVNEVNVAPVLDLIAKQTVNEGTLLTFTATASDHDIPANVLSFSLHDAPLGATIDSSSGLFSWMPVEGPQSAVITVKVTDTGTPPLSDTQQVTINVNNVAPHAVLIAASVGELVFAVGSSQPFSGSFMDVGTEDTHAAVWTFTHLDDTGATVTETRTGTVAQGSGSGTVSDSFAFTAAGVYKVTLTVTDDDKGAASSLTSIFVVYDPSAGFVTGGGWITSPEGADRINPTATGKANFGFVSQYKKGATTPTGQTEFQFQAGDLKFHSASYDWLVVAGARAQYKGVGTINGTGNYGFMLTAIDGQVNGGGGVDKFRIKIWDKVTGDLRYDNQLDAADDAALTTALGGGQIVIQSGGKKLTLLGNETAAVGTAGLTVTTAQLTPFVDRAVTYWASQGIRQDRLASLWNLEVGVAQFTGATLGMASDSTNYVWVDADAAGYGWSLDSDGSGVDLLSTLTHEIGHRLGFEHDILGATLAVGERRLPSLAAVPLGLGRLATQLENHSEGSSARDLLFRAWEAPTTRRLPIVLDAPSVIDSVFARYETGEDTDADDAGAADLALMLSV